MHSEDFYLTHIELSGLLKVTVVGFKLTKTICNTLVERQMGRRTPDSNVNDAPILVVNGVGTSSNGRPKHAQQNKPLRNEKIEILEQELHSPLKDATSDDPEEIEEIHLAPIDVLTTALDTANPLIYYQALTVNAETRSLERRAEQLKHRLDIEVRIKSRRLKHKFFGWSGLSWLQQPQSPDLDMDKYWKMLRSASAHEFDLEDPHVSQLFFNNLRELMSGQDMEMIHGQWGPLFGNQLDAYFQSYPSVSSKQFAWKFMVTNMYHETDLETEISSPLGKYK